MTPKERNQLVYGKIRESVARSKEQSISAELQKRDLDPS